MKKSTFGIASSALSGILVATLFACNVPSNQPSNNNLSNNSNTVVSQNNLKATQYSLTGTVNMDNSSFKTKASFADLVSGASVTLLDSTNSALGPSVSTNTNGTFTFTPNASFVPVTGAIYTLEASKRAGASAAGSPLLSVRTLVRWNGSSYDSITTGGLYLNTYTTALAIIASRGDVTPASTINTVVVANNSSTPTAIAPAGGNMGADANKINNVTRLVQQSINFQADPIATITYNAGNYSIGLSPTAPLSNNGAGTQMDRLAIPSLNIVINGYNGFTKAAYDSLGMTKAMRDTAKDLSNTQSPANDIANYRSFWTTAIGAVFPDSTKTRPDQLKASELATALTPDVYTLDMTKATSFATLNGRLLADDVVDVELQLLSGVNGKDGNPAATDGVNANDRPFTTTFPYLAGPQ